MACSNCGREKEQARGFCSACYIRWLKSGSPHKTKCKNISACIYCGQVKQIVGRGFCRTCFQRWWRHGTPEKREPKGIRPDNIAECSFCKKVAKLKHNGFCNACYIRNNRHGSPNYVKIKHICLIPDCGEFVKSNGLCQKHYSQKRKDDGANKGFHPLYPTWNTMKQRCLNPNCKSYVYYGAKGITICDRWANDFHAFIQDMGDKPTPKHSIDRIDNSKGYFPENCRWATAIEQSHNSSRVVLNDQVVADIRTSIQNNTSFTDLGKTHDCSRHAISSAIYGKTWKDIPGAIDTQLRRKRKVLDEKAVIEIRNQVVTGTKIKYLAETYNCTGSTIRRAASGKDWGHIPGALGNNLLQYRCKNL